MKYSEQIDNFLTFLRESAQLYSMAAADETEADAETQDILHCLELGENSWYNGGLLAQAMRDVRKRRRIAKDTQAQLAPVLEWAENHHAAVKALERALGDTRKMERNAEARQYSPRTGVVKETLGR